MVLMELNQLGRQDCHNVKMKKYLIACCFGLFSVAGYATPAIVDYVIDGDTFVGTIMLKDGTEIESVSVRLRNVDTPEIHGQCEKEITMAVQAKERLQELIPVGSVVEIKNIKDDKYAGRIDANVFDSSNRDVGLVLIREKLGRHYSGGKRQSWCD